ncbi:MAG TPA: transporter [Cyanobacteria bacterium UBA11149]|nr:transporter [Cyanobacteria bacterium UBA11367]HBE60329.1 transporter [Cyanobacteria bacterium UBA11366]HBS68750.1 transporter [Cyanobacteria bacterium UBA11153]HBW89080.1 transporter [Cyanobacteria bacterium UBA11149]HCA98145.1 transporter [Cyanobacteria bacterium UBA9226]
MENQDFEIWQPLIKVYLQLGGGIVLGWVLGRVLPQQMPLWIGKFLFWIGIPVSIIAFLRNADLSGSIWIAPVVGWMAILLGLGLSWLWWERRSGEQKVSATQGSFILAAMVGNTGYLGFPISLALVGQKYFAWALFYDMLGTVLGAYGLGVVLAARFGKGGEGYGHLWRSLAINPALWSLPFGLAFREIHLPLRSQQILSGFAWIAIALAVILIGMRLSQLSSWGKITEAAVSLSIKMFLVPLVLGLFLFLLGISGSPLLVIVLQMAMPPAFATLVLAEVYDLDRDLAVTALSLGSVALLLTLPIWLLLFGFL